AAQAIAAGDMTYAIGAGVESMTRVPMAADMGGSYEKVNPEIRTRYGLIHQGESAERLADKWHIRREAVDALAIESHRRAAQAARAGRHREMLPTPGTNADGVAFTLTRDEGIREVVAPKKLASLPTVFRPGGNGVVTAGNASQISDGASAVLLANREVALAEG